jgi:hypothetical protein
MQTSKWGPSTWIFLHSVTFNYPDNPTSENKKHIYELFNNLRYTLPCKYCRESYDIFFKYIDLNEYLDDKMGLTYWLYTIHNIVNMKLGKKTVDFIDVVIFYDNIKANNNNKCNCNIESCKECNYNFEFVKNTKLKYDKITKKFIKNLIKSQELNISKIIV